MWNLWRLRLMPTTGNPESDAMWWKVQTRYIQDCGAEMALVWTAVEHTLPNIPFEPE